MTICAVGAFIGAMLAGIGLEVFLSGYALFTGIAVLWLVAMGYLWFHFYLAARENQLAPSSTGLFHKIQFVAFAFAAIPFFVWRTSNLPRLFFSTISFGVEGALTAFFVCHIFLSATLCKRVPRSAFVGLVIAGVGLYFSYQQILTLPF